MRQDAMNCHRRGENSITFTLQVMPGGGGSYLLTIAHAAGTLACMEGVEFVFVWTPKLCCHWMFH